MAPPQRQRHQVAVAVGRQRQQRRRAAAAAAPPQPQQHQEHNFEVAEQHWLASIVVAARANGKPLALGSSRFLVLADVPYVENNTTRAIGTLVGTLNATLSNHCILRYSGC